MTEPTDAMTPPSACPDRDASVSLSTTFARRVRERDYPCVGAKSAIANDQMTAYVGRSLTSSWDDVQLSSELIQFAHDYKCHRPLFLTFVALFPDTPELDEPAFERALWSRIQSLQSKDRWFGQQPDPSVSGDPASPTFSLSFGGQAFFVVGMHPAASRPARQFDCPVMVFNLHDQFERLRADGRYEKMRSTILDRDRELAGNINPMLARHGEQSEARQYSGRIVGPDWECPWPGRETEKE